VQDLGREGGGRGFGMREKGRVFKVQGSGCRVQDAGNRCWRLRKGVGMFASLFEIYDLGLRIGLASSEFRPSGWT